MGKVFKNYRDESKKNWGVTIDETETITSELLQFGCLLRIADATELMAQNYVRLQNDVDMYKRWYKERGDEIQHLTNKIRSLKGVITKLKK